MMNELFQTTYLELVLGEMAEDVRNGYVDQLTLHDRVASGNLISTVKTIVEKNGTEYEVSLMLQDYWKYVENDTRPHWPPPDAILQWIAVKPVIPRPDEDGRIPTPKQLAFLIGRKISEEGTTGTHDLEKTLDAVLPMWEERILDALQRDTIEYIAKITG